MVKEIVRDTFFLQIKSKPADESDLQTAADLLDTLKAHSDRCIGMAANMIGVSKRIIAVNIAGEYILMINPEILRCAAPYEAQEGCLSLDGQRAAKRFKTIKVKWQDEKFRFRIKTFTDFPAQIIQHEIDHCNGIII